MKKPLKKILIGGIAISFLLSIPNVLTKIETENSSRTVEITADYRQLVMSSEKSKFITEDRLLSSLKESGVTTIGLNQNSLSTLEERKILHTYSGNEFEKNFWNLELPFSIQKDNTYIVVPSNERQKETISTIVSSKIGNVEINQLKDAAILAIDEQKATIQSKPLLYLESDYEKFKNDFFISPRISNEWKERLPIIKEQLSRWNESKKLSHIVFEGSEVVGFNEETNKTSTDELLKEIGVASIEVFEAKQKQNGINDYVVNSSFQSVRLHSIPTEKLKEISEKDLSIMVEKAAKERNIRDFYINIPTYDGVGTPEEYMNNIAGKTSVIHEALIRNNAFSVGQAEPFKENTNNWIYSFGLYASMLGSLFLFLLALLSFITKKAEGVPSKLFYLAIISGSALIFTSLENDLFQSIISLGLSVLLPIWTAMLLITSLDKFDITQRNIFIHLILPILTLYIVGLTYLTSMNAGIEKILYVEGFKGVSLTLSLPPLLVGLYLLLHFKDKLKLNKLFTHRIRIIDVVMLGILGVFFAFYESRSGNAGSLLPFEANIRNWLEELLTVRPRTKEIFFAFPLLVVMIAFWKESKWVRLLLPFVIIGFASVFNTFTHFHTPLEYSAIRTILSVVLGSVIGMVLTMFLKPIYEECKKVYPNISKHKKNA